MQEFNRWTKETKRPLREASKPLPPDERPAHIAKLHREFVVGCVKMNARPGRGIPCRSSLNQNCRAA
jgi:hypothetical protein